MAFRVFVFLIVMELDEDRKYPATTLWFNLFGHLDIAFAYVSPF